MIEIPKVAIPDDLPIRSAIAIADGYRLTYQAEHAATIERWAIEHAGHVPAQVSAGKFWVALYRKDATLCAAIEQLVQADPEMRLAAMHEPAISRQGQRVLQVQAWCQGNGFAHVTDAWLDELFREAALVEL